MNIQRVVPVGIYLKVLDYLDSQIFPTDDLYPKKKRYWWVLKDGKNAVGFAGLEVQNQSTAFLCRAGILPAFRKRGMHRHLIWTREKYARAKGIEQLVTYCHPENLRSANNLVSCGYRLYKPVKPFGFDNALYFRKELL